MKLNILIYRKYIKYTLISKINKYPFVLCIVKLILYQFIDMYYYTFNKF